MSLRRKINFSLLGALVVTLLGYAFIDTFLSQSALEERIQVNAESTEKRLGITLADSMWNFNVTTAENIAKAELGTNDLVGLVAYNLEDEVLFTISWDAENNQPRNGRYDGEELFTRNKDIIYNDGTEEFKAGRVKLYFSDDSLTAALNRSIQRSIYQVVTLSIILLTVTGFLIHRLILMPLGTITSRVNDIAQGEGDLTKRVRVESQDELGALGQGINQFIENVHGIITDVCKVSMTLDQSSDASRKDITELNNLVSDLNEKVLHIVQSMQEMSATSKDVADQAAGSAGVMQETTHMAEQGLTDVNHANDMTQQLAESVRGSTEKTAKLDEHSQSIGAVVDVIKSIAEQTNLLALNAAIEAARAGEQGRGFAVVADEVRTLAQRTQSSTGEIEEIITQLQGQAKDTHTIMSSGLDRAKNNVESVAKAGDTFAKIEDAISKNLDSATMIATAAEEQSQTLISMESNIEFIKSANDRTLEIARKSASSNEQMVDLSHKVASLVEQFKI